MIACGPGDWWVMPCELAHQEDDAMHPWAWLVMPREHKTNLAEKVKTKKQTDNEKTKKPCHRRTIRTYIYEGLPCRVSP